MYSEYSKWSTIRVMCHEKNLEIIKVVSMLSNGFERDENIKTINYAIKRRFLTKNKMEEFGSNWRNCISSVDLLHLYNYLNRILYCIYTHAPIRITEIKRTEDILTDYEIRYSGYLSHTNNFSTIFSAIEKSIKSSRFNEVDPYFIKTGDKATIQFTGKPTKQTKVKIPKYDMQYRREIVSLLIDDAIERYEQATKTKCKDNFQTARDKFCLNSYPYTELGMGDVRLIEPIIFEDDNIKPKFLGLDINGHPVYEDSNGDLVDNAGAKLPEDTYIDQSCFKEDTNVLGK